ncbi:MAG: lysophospholipid acyltransferase family protein [Planctomycetia bacterium]|nr:lysophospholipid acyltransferase family protein [Planctomycetia bacterium]
MIKNFFRRCFYNFVKTLVWIYFVIYFRVRYLHNRKIPSEGAVLIVANHESFLDPPLVGIGCLRICHYMARSTLFEGEKWTKRFFGRIIHLLNAFPVSLEGSGYGGVKETLKRLKAGNPVVIFPEGTRSDCGMLPFRAGFISLARRGKAAIVPCGVYGAGLAFPRGKKFPKCQKITVAYGDAISVEEMAEMTDDEILKSVEEKVRQLISEAEMSQKRKGGNSS